jgi:hypothetical protein
MLVSACPRNGSSRMIGRYRMAITGARHGGTRHLTGESRLFDRDGTGIRRQGFGGRLDSGSNPPDDDEIDVLEDTNGDPVARELASFIRAMNEDEQVDLVALMWLGRGDGTIEEWEELRTRSAERRSGYRRPRWEIVRYVLGEPLLGDLLADGLDKFGYSWADEEERLVPDASSESERNQQ